MPVKIPDDAVEKTFLLDSVIKNRPSLGVIINNINSSQFGFEILHQAHLILERSNRVEILFFCENWKRPCITPPSGIFHMTELFGYRGVALSATVDGILDAIRIRTIKDRIWYINDITEISTYNEEIIKVLLQDPGIHKILRDESYIELLMQFTKLTKIDYDVMPKIDLNSIIVNQYGQKYDVFSSRP